MRFNIRHTTVYRYDRPVALGEHVFRLHPREDEFLTVRSFELSIYPPPAEITKALDFDGNLTHLLGFSGQTPEFRVSFHSTGETRPLLASVSDHKAGQDAVNENPSLMEVYLHIDPLGNGVRELAAEIARETDFRTLAFLEALNRRLFENVRNFPRLIGEPLDPETTLREGRGSCRDLAMLFIACCRCQGIAARFVSGYFPASPGDLQHMHAWAQAYIPGVGWRAYDPTQGREAGPTHVASAAAADPRDATPILGVFTSAGARSEMSVDLMVKMDPD